MNKDFTLNRIYHFNRFSFMIIGVPISNSSNITEIFNEWQRSMSHNGNEREVLSQNPNSLRIPLSILLNSTDLSFFSVALNIINDNLLKFWIHYDINQRVEYLDGFFSLIFKYQAIDDQIFYNQIEFMSEIAILEFPNDNLTISKIFSQDDSNTEIKLMMVNILIEKIDCLNREMKIRKKQFQKYIFIAHIEKIMNLIEKCIGNETFSKKIISLLNKIIKWNFKMDYTNSIEQERIELKKAFFKFVSSLIHIISNKLKNSKSPDFLQFIINFLTKNSNYLDDHLINNRNYLEEKQSITNDLDFLYHEIISIQKELLSGDLLESFLTFWLQKIRKMAKDHKTVIPVSIFDEVLPKLIDILPNINKSNYINLMQPILFNIQQIDSVLFNDILNAMDQSVNLCYAIASFELARKQDSIIIDIVNDTSSFLFNFRNAGDSEYQCALLFSLSHLSKYLTNNILIEFVYFIIESIFRGKTEKVVKEATYALKCLIKYQSKNLDISIFLYDEIVSKSSEFLQILQKNEAKRVFKSCIKLIIYGNLNGKNLEKLFQPILTIFEMPSFSHETVEKAVFIISKCCKKYRLFLKFLFEPIYSFAFEKVAKKFIPFETAELIFEIIECLILNYKDNELENQIEKMAKLIGEYDKIERSSILL